MDIEKIMTPNVAYVKSGDTLSTAARAMWDFDCGAIPVVDAADRVIGIISYVDVLEALRPEPAGHRASRVARSRASSR